MHLNEAGCLVQTAWDELSARFPGVELDAFVVMPNHVHGIVVLVGAGLALPSKQDAIQGAASSAPTEPGTARPATLGGVVRAFKSISALYVNRQLTRSGPLWQRNYYERIIRDEAELQRIREYIETNPAGWADDRENPSGSV